jgi:hypothetical protein
MRKALFYSISLLLVIAAAAFVFDRIIAGEKVEDDIPKTPGPRHIWELNFHLGIKVGDGDPFDPDDKRPWKFEKPQTIVIKNETGEPEPFWFIFYTIQNHDEEDHPIFINVGAISDKANASTYGAVDKSGGQMASKESAIYNDLTQAEVMKVVEKQFINELQAGADKKLWTWRDLCFPAEIGKKGTIKEDEMDNGINLPVLSKGETRRCIAIFNRLDNEAKTLKIYWQGLTNDFKMKTHLDDPSLTEFERLVTERVYEVVFDRNGDEFWTLEDAINFVSKGWVEWSKKIRTDLKHDPVYPGAEK